MKIFQIVESFCHWDATYKFNSLENVYKTFPETDLFVEAPDYVFEGWGYDDTQEGDDRFIKPLPPEGWLYDENTGTFYEENTKPWRPIENRIETLETLVEQGGAPPDTGIYKELAEAIKEGVESI